MIWKMIGLSAGLHLLALPWATDWLTNPPPTKREVKVSLRVTPMSPAVQASTGVRKQSKRAKHPLPAPRVAKATPQVLDSNPPARLIPPSRVKKEEAKYRTPPPRKRPVPAVARARKQPVHRPPEARAQSLPEVNVSKTEVPRPVIKRAQSLPEVNVSKTETPRPVIKRAQSLPEVNVSKTETPRPVIKRAQSLPEVNVGKTEAPRPVIKKRSAIDQPSVSLVRPHPKKKPSKGISTVQPLRATPGQSSGSGRPRPRLLTRAKPPYPAESKRRGEEGVVTLRIEVLSTGRVGKVEVAESSGHELLDHAARQFAAAWRFKFRGKRPDRSTLVKVPVRFELKNVQ